MMQSDEKVMQSAPTVRAAGAHALVTGSAGFIGSHLVDRLLTEGWKVTGLDNFDPYYSEAEKRRNMAGHTGHPNFRFHQADVSNADELEVLDGDYDVIIHLAAKVGVRNSLLDPLGYQKTNIVGTQNMLSLAANRGPKPFVCASSSSVYGNCPRFPLSEDDPDLSPLNPYASTKLADEYLGRVYAEAFGLRFIGLRFFTVYGPRQRPDLAIHRFARMILASEPIPVYGDGTSERDYTYCDDIVTGVISSVRHAMDQSDGSFEVVNLGHDRAITLIDMIGQLEAVLGREAIIEWREWQPADMRRTRANLDKAHRLLGYTPATAFVDGLHRFADWLQEELASEHTVQAGHQ